jgi:threonine dehydrogenase-like Zn-dependent dehydrogenase
VIGTGPIGLMFTALLEAAGAEVVAIEPTEQRAALALRLGAVRVVDPAAEEAVAAVREATDGLGADVVVDAVGSQLETALSVVRKAGRIVLFGMNSHARSEVAQVEITRSELNIIGAYVGLNQFPRAVRLLEADTIDFGSLVSHRVSLPQMPDAVEELRAGRAVKAVIEFS